VRLQLLVPGRHCGFSGNAHFAFSFDVMRDYRSNGKTKPRS
jgi:hypothetical protein